jgi:hypothetical protein
MHNAAPAAVILRSAQRRRASRRNSSRADREAAAATPTPGTETAAGPTQNPDPIATIVPQTTASPRSTAETLPTPIIAGLAQSTDQTSVVTPSSESIAHQSVRTPNLSMPVSLALLSLILLALIVVVIKLRRQLRAP